MRKLKGFSLRRPGRPVGSRAIDRVQSDLFPVEKVLSQCGWQNLRFPAAAARSAAGARTAEPEQRKRLYVPVTRKVIPEIRKKGGVS